MSSQALDESEKENGFKSIKRDWATKWKDRNDLFDYVVTKSVEFIAGFINQVWKLKETHTCCIVSQ